MAKGVTVPGVPISKPELPNYPAEFTQIGEVEKIEGSYPFGSKPIGRGDKETETTVVDEKVGTTPVDEQAEDGKNLLMNRKNSISIGG